MLKRAYQPPRPRETPHWLRVAGIVLLTAGVGATTYGAWLDARTVVQAEQAKLAAHAFDREPFWPLGADALKKSMARRGGWYPG